MAYVFTNCRYLELSWLGLPAADAYRRASRTTPPTTNLPEGVTRLRTTPRRVALEALTPVENAQAIAAIWPRSDAPTFAAFLEQRAHIFRDDMDILEHIEGAPIEWWDVLEGQGEVAYQLWLYGNDCGALFGAGSDTFIAAVSQYSFVCLEDPPLWRALARAHHQAASHHPETELAHMTFHRWMACPKCAHRFRVWVSSFEASQPCPQCHHTIDTES